MVRTTIYWRLKRPVKKYVGRKWQLLWTPKAQRPVKKLLWQKMDEAQEQMVAELGAKLYGNFTDLDGLGFIVDPGVNTSGYDEMFRTNYENGRKNERAI